MNKKLIYLVLFPLLLAGCGGPSESSVSPSTSGGGSSSTSGSSSIPASTSIDPDDLKAYVANLAKTSKSNHFYYHYYRYAQTAADFNNWDVWSWPYRPNEGQGARFDWVGRTSSSDHMSATGDAIIDNLGYVTIDIDLTKVYDGGWNATKHTMGGKETIFLPDGVVDDTVSIGVQIVYSDSRISDSGFWKNDGGNVYLNLNEFALNNDDGTKSYHAFAVQDNATKPSALPGDATYNPFDYDDGTNVTYGKSEYKTADWNDKAIQATSTSFADKGVGYQIMVASFADSDGDGFGDIYGIEQKLDYLKDLGVGVLWLTPIQKSDSYHGYDISDYLKVDAKYGSSVSPAGSKNFGKVTEETAMKDYKSLLDAAHERDMLVVMDLVLNHTSTTNDWFINSAQLDKTMRAYYQWGNNDTQKDNINETNFWYPYGDHVYSYYAKFGSSMPELNYAYADTRTAVETMAKNWCEIGVDGFRMDAVKHIFLEDEIDYDSNDTYIKDVGSGINYSSDLTKNLNFWKELNYEVKKDYPNAFFVGENFDGHAYHVAPFYEGFDSLFDFYSYFNLTSIANSFYKNGSTGAYQGAHAATFMGAWNSTATKYSASSDADLFGNKSKSIKYGDGWNLTGVMNTNNKYRSGGALPNATNGYAAINGAFTSNHDIARTINRIAGEKWDINGLIAQGEVDELTYGRLLDYTTLVQINEILLPGITWIYYGDELGMTGNFGSGRDADSPYSDLAYRQPMKWVQGGKVGDGSMTTGYGISGSEKAVEWDEVNKSTTVPSVEVQTAAENSHYNILKAFATAKNTTAALGKGMFTAYYADITSSDLQKSVASFKRTLGNESYRVVVNYGNTACNISTGGTVVASYNGATASVVPAKSAVLVKLDGGDTPVAEGYGIIFEGGTKVQANEAGTSPDGKQQYSILGQDFEVGDKFALYDFGKQVSWTIALDSASLNKQYTDYIEKTNDWYTIKKAFKGDLYIKLKLNADELYIGFAS